MRRALVIFMLMLLPFQLVWGAAASYCQHEQGAGGGHFGHHVHKHQGKVLKASGEVSPDSKSFVGDDDPDCASCHLTCVSPVMNAVVGFVSDLGEPLRAALTYGHPRHVPYSIERPNWTLAA